MHPAGKHRQKSGAERLATGLQAQRELRSSYPRAKTEFFEVLGSGDAGDFLLEAHT